MKTFIYMVRHGYSLIEGNERRRALTEKGAADAKVIADLLHGESFAAVISSPYERSILTVQQIAQQLGKEVIIVQDLKERVFSKEDGRISDKELFPLLNRSFSEPTFALKGGESNADCQKRAVKFLKEVLNTYQGQKVVIGTHGCVMTLIMRNYASKYDLNFLL
ncbi:histidine phosphatase family protein, partial [Peribacillus psychrosaccharolyticus]